ncbi:MAG TPA: GAF domain-containing sensor histidine kinase [Bryobacteraceae bacterium]|nr:GAF domain-containing sensor histidine kinase [Bryobacteraceae bacterium]
MSSRKPDARERKKSDRLTSEVAALDRLRQTNDELWQSHDLRTGLEQMLQAGIALLGADMGKIQLLNPARQILTIAAHRGFRPDFLEHFREVSAADNSACGRGLRTGKRIIIEDVNEDPKYEPHRAAAAAAGYRAVQSTPLFGRDGAPIGIFSTHFGKPHRPSELDLIRFDLYASQAGQFIERLRNEAQLQRLTRALLFKEEETRRLIARELHDVFSQELAVVGMEISSLKREGKSEAEHAACLSELGQKIGDLAKRLHQTSRELHPAILEELGLEPALRQECESFQTTSGIWTDFAARNLPAQIPRDVALCLYRVAQEGLRNIQKHAIGTNKVGVSVTGNRDGINLTVRDQGDGFDLDEALRKGGLGLISMEERVRAENGTVRILSKPGKGTTLTVFVPLER